MVKVGIVGLGFMAATHIKAYRQIPEAQLVAVCNPSGRHLDGDLSKVAGNVGDNAPVKLDMSQIKAYRNFDEMLADPGIDLIDICTPTAAHPSQAVAALKAGKHVLCEKPLARTPELAREIVAAAKSAKGFFMPAMCVRFLPEWVWVKEAIANETYGKVLGARFRRVAEPPGWGQHNFFDGERSGGALLDLHIHDTDFVQFCFGRPKAVLSAGYVKFSGAVDHVITQYQVASGAMVHAEGSWAMTGGFGFTMSYTVNFEKATVDYDMARGADSLKVFELGQPARVVKCEGPDCYAREMRHLIEAITNGKAPTIVTAEDALSAVEICEAEAKSVKTGQWVAL
jgi:predicted dehydrogenase